MATKVIKQIDKSHQGQVIHRTIREHRGGLRWEEKHYDMDGRQFGLSWGFCPRGEAGLFPDLFK